MSGFGEPAGAAYTESGYDDEPFVTAERLAYIGIGVLVMLVGLLIFDFGSGWINAIGIVIFLVGLFIDAIGCGLFAFD